MKLTPQQQLMSWVVGGTLCLTIGAWFAFFPLRQKLQEKNVKILEARISREVNNRQQQNLSALKKQVDQILENTETLNAAFFNRAETLQFLKYIEDLAEREKLTLAEPQLSAPARTSPDTATTYSVEEKAFHFDVQGPIAALMRFLRALETHPSYILVQTVNLQNGSVAKQNSLVVEGVIPWH
ncbi:MAG: hypothetical protein AAB445_00305 [Patescibacteria group bacterium]